MKEILKQILETLNAINDRLSKPPEPKTYNIDNTHDSILCPHVPGVQAASDYLRRQEKRLEEARQKGPHHEWNAMENNPLSFEWQRTQERLLEEEKRKEESIELTYIDDCEPVQERTAEDVEALKKWWQETAPLCRLRKDGKPLPKAARPIVSVQKPNTKGGNNEKQGKRTET